MRVIGRQARFLVVVLAGYVCGRAYFLLPDTGRAVRASHKFSRRSAVSIATFPPMRAEPVAALLSQKHPGDRKTVLQQAQDDRGGGTIVLPDKPTPVITARVEAPPVPPLAGDRPSRPRRLEAQAYFYFRPGRGLSALGQGELGGSQIAARVAWRFSPALAAAARLYVPIGSKGAEIAAGIDLHPFPNAPFRISVERRQRLDAAGRSAWSAYGAGGFYRGGKPGGIELDGYAQAGLVGVERRDGFVDGALRIGYRLPIRTAIVVGAGAWGAAQPGVARIDIGPRATVRLPIERHIVTLALDGRFRVAGQARPGSGAALTLAVDY